MCHHLVSPSVCVHLLQPVPLAFGVATHLSRQRQCTLWLLCAAHSLPHHSWLYSACRHQGTEICRFAVGCCLSLVVAHAPLCLPVRLSHVCPVMHVHAACLCRLLSAFSTVCVFSCVAILPVPFPLVAACSEDAAHFSGGGGCYTHTLFACMV